MAETTADVKRDIELTRERMSSTLAELEKKLNVAEVVRDHPWPALALAVGAGIALGTSGADVKAAAATAGATKGAGSKVGAVLDDIVAQLMTGVTAALQGRVEEVVGEVKRVIGAPATKPLVAYSGNGAGFGTGPTHDLAQPGTTPGQTPRAD